MCQFTNFVEQTVETEKKKLRSQQKLRIFAFNFIRKDHFAGIAKMWELYFFFCLISFAVVVVVTMASNLIPIHMHNSHSGRWLIRNFIKLCIRHLIKVKLRFQILKWKKWCIDFSIGHYDQVSLWKPKQDKVRITKLD